MTSTRIISYAEKRAKLFGVSLEVEGTFDILSMMKQKTLKNPASMFTTKVAEVVETKGMLPGVDKLAEEDALKEVEQVGTEYAEAWVRSGSPKLEQNIVHFMNQRTTSGDVAVIRNPANIISLETVNMNFSYDSDTRPMTTIEYGASSVYTERISTTFAFASLADKTELSIKGLCDRLQLSTDTANTVALTQGDTLRKMIRHATAYSDHTARFVKGWLHYYALCINNMNGRRCTLRKYARSDIEYKEYSLDTLLYINTVDATPIACNWINSPDYVECLTAITGRYPYYEWRGSTNIYTSVGLMKESHPVMIAKGPRTSVDAPPIEDPEQWLAMLTQYAFDLNLQKEFQRACLIAAVLPYAKANDAHKHTIPVSAPSTMLDAFMFCVEPVYLPPKCYLPREGAVRLLMGAYISNILVDGCVRQIGESVVLSEVEDKNSHHNRVVREMNRFVGSTLCYEHMSAMIGPAAQAFGMIASLQNCRVSEIWAASHKSISLRWFSHKYKRVIKGSSLQTMGMLALPTVYERDNAKSEMVSDYWAYLSYLTENNAGRVVPPAWNHSNDKRCDTQCFSGLEGMMVKTTVTDIEVPIVVKPIKHTYRVYSNVIVTPETLAVPYLPGSRTTHRDSGVVVPSAQVDVLERYKGRYTLKERDELTDDMRIRRPRKHDSVTYPTESRTEKAGEIAPEFEGVIRALEFEPLAMVLMCVFGARTSYSNMDFKRYDQGSSVLHVPGIDIVVNPVLVRNAGEVMRSMAVAKSDDFIVAALRIAADMCDVAAGKDLAGMQSYFKTFLSPAASAGFRTKVAGMSRTSLSVHLSLRDEVDADCKRLRSIAKNVRALEDIPIHEFERIAVSSGYGDCGPAAFIEGGDYDGVWSTRPGVAELRKLAGTIEPVTGRDTSQAQAFWSIQTLLTAAQMYGATLYVHSRTSGTTYTHWAGDDRPRIYIELHDAHFFALRAKTTPIPSIEPMVDVLIATKRERRNYWAARSMERRTGTMVSASDLKRKFILSRQTVLPSSFIDEVISHSVWGEIAFSSDEELERVMFAFVQLVMNEFETARFIKQNHSHALVGQYEPAIIGGLDDKPEQ